MKKAHPLTELSRAARDGWSNIKKHSRRKGIQMVALAMLLALLMREDFSFQLSLGKPESFSASMANDNAYYASAELASFESSEEVLKKAEPSAKRKSAKKVSMASLNVANEATATSSAFTEEERQAAEEISNLIVLLNPDYIRRKNLSREVARKKYNNCIQYVRQYLKVAREQARKVNIPVSITLAQGLLESNAGDSRLSQKANNHFGIKCFSRTCSKGHCMNATDDSHKDFFIIFPSGEESFRARSAFLQKDRYKHLLKLKPTNYKAWANGLKKAGYATDPHYAEKLIKIIEGLKLYVYDNES